MTHGDGERDHQILVLPPLDTVTYSMFIHFVVRLSLDDGGRQWHCYSSRGHFARQHTNTDTDTGIHTACSMAHLWLAGMQGYLSIEARIRPDESSRTSPD